MGFILTYAHVCIPVPPQKELLLACYFQLSKQLECRTTSGPASDNLSRVSSALKWGENLYVVEATLWRLFPTTQQTHDSVEDQLAELRQASAGSRAA